MTSVLRPDLVKSAVHYEPVDHHIFDGDRSRCGADHGTRPCPYSTEVAALQQAHFKRWRGVFEAKNSGDFEHAAELMMDVVFENLAGGYRKERESQKEVVRQNAMTLDFLLSGKNNGLLTCTYAGGVSVPTMIVSGSDLKDPYWRMMSKRFADCIPESSTAVLKGGNHRGPLDQVAGLTEIITEFVDQNR